MNLHLFPYSGISGDMFLGLLVDLGLPLSQLEEMTKMLKLPEVQLRSYPAEYHGLVGTKVDVLAEEQTDHRHLPDIEEIIDDSALPPLVKTRAKQCFWNLAEAEAKVHGTTPEEIHFHEVGALDAIVDICGTIYGLSVLQIEEVTSQEVSIGTGFVQCEHGRMPVPVPAVCELLKGIPTRSTGFPYELTTPTGAALLKTLSASFCSKELRTFQKIGYGAGSRNMEEVPNFLRGYLWEKPSQTDQVVLLETNIDDSTPERLGYVMERLFQAGALDVYMTAIQMKKNRPGVLFSCLASLGQEHLLEKLLFEETSTFGIRKQQLTRTLLERHWEEVETPFGRARMKVGKGPHASPTLSPEYEDCKKLALQTNRPLQEVIAAVFQAYGSQKK